MNSSKLNLSTFILVLFSHVVFAQVPNRPSSPNDSLVSTEVLDDGKVIFKIYAPKASEVALGGDMVPWGQKIVGEKDDQGIWTLSVPKVKNGTYRYHFMVDGVKVFDPKAPSAKEVSALIDVTSGSGDDFFGIKEDVAHGAVSYVYYYSNATNSMRRMHIWSPPGYHKEKSKLPVLYLLHGGGDSDLAWPTVGRAGFIMDNLLAENKAKEMIVVMPDGGLETSLFVEDFVNDLIPFIESNYNVYTDAENKALAGLSMGGLQVLETMLTHPEMFGYLNVMSSGWFTNNEEMYRSGDERLASVGYKLNQTAKLLLFTQGGEEDIAYQNGKEMLKVFDKNDVNYEYSEMAGGHSWYVWRHDLYNFAQRIF